MVSKGRLAERARSYTKRRVEQREQAKRFLIVCEGQETEPNYFRGFNVPGVVITVEGLGANTISVVNAAIRLAGKGKFDEVWCVFDKDSFDDDRFNGALTRAAAAGIRVAYSNEAFELWYILHFDYLTAGVPRRRYQEMLTERMKAKYEKNDDTIFLRLLPLQQTAISHARKLLSSYDPHHPHLDNPSTTVHLLVEALRDSEQ